MSAIRIKVEEASSVSREDFVRDVSPLITPDEVATPYLAKARRAFRGGPHHAEIAHVQ
jgi:hypothetical protein